MKNKLTIRLKITKKNIKLEILMNLIIIKNGPIFWSVNKKINVVLWIQFKHGKIQNTKGTNNNFILNEKNINNLLSKIPLIKNIVDPINWIMKYLNSNSSPWQEKFLFKLKKDKILISIPDQIKIQLYLLIIK